MNRQQRLGIGLLFGWLALPFVTVAGLIFFAIFADGELGAFSIAFTAVTEIPLVISTWYFVCLAVRDFRGSAMGWRLVVGSILLIAFVFVGANAFPCRTPEEFDFGSPFDQYWYFAPQTHFGYPFPFYRIFDCATPDPDVPKIGKHLFDPSSFIGDLVFLSFAVYVFVCFAILARSSSLGRLFKYAPKLAERVREFHLRIATLLSP